MIQIISTKLRIPFMKFQIPMILFSTFLTGAALYFIFTKGFNYGVDFEGGVQIVLSLPEGSKVDAEQLRKGFKDIGLPDASVQAYGTQFDKKPHDFIVHFPADFLDDGSALAKVEQSLASSRPGDMAKDEKLVQQFRFVGLEKAYLTLSRPVNFEGLKKSVSGVDFGMLKFVEIAPFGRGSQNEFQIGFVGIGKTVTEALSKALGAETEVTIQKVDFVGAKVGSDLRTSAILSLIIMIALIFVYIFVRFDLVYAPGVVLALIHDVLITAGFFAMTGMEFDLTIVAALLTLAGYSINDTIVVYDRVRELSATMKGKPFNEIIDLSINQMLGRTIITGGSTFIATLALWIFGGPVIHGFAIAFLIGIVVGTYSSVFIAAPTIALSRKLLGMNDARLSKVAA